MLKILYMFVSLSVGRSIYDSCDSLYTSSARLEMIFDIHGLLVYVAPIKEASGLWKGEEDYKKSCKDKVSFILQKVSLLRKACRPTGSEFVTSYIF